MSSYSIHEWQALLFALGRNCLCLCQIEFGAQSPFRIIYSSPTEVSTLQCQLQLSRSTTIFFQFKCNGRYVCSFFYNVVSKPAYMQTKKYLQNILAYVCTTYNIMKTHGSVVARSMASPNPLIVRVAVVSLSFCSKC